MIGRRGKLVANHVPAAERCERKKKWQLEIEQEGNSSGEEGGGASNGKHVANAASDGRVKQAKSHRKRRRSRSPRSSCSRSSKAKDRGSGRRKKSKRGSPSGKHKSKNGSSCRGSANSSPEPDAVSPKHSSQVQKAGKKKNKEFAWMDSSDDEGGSSSGELHAETDNGLDAGRAAGGQLTSRSRSPSLGPPPAARDVQTLGQMMRVADAIKKKAGGKKKVDLSADELLDLCQAAARIKFYDPELFQDTLAPALLRCFRSGLDSSDVGSGKTTESKQFSLDGGLEIVCTLASLNAASALTAVFQEAANAFRETGVKLSKAQRRLLNEVYSTIDRVQDIAFLAGLGPPSDSGPTEIRGSVSEGVSVDGLPMRPGQRICESYLKTGNCRSGAACRWDHPEGFRVTYNSDGYPVRPWAPVCPYYMAMGTCDHRNTCKWHHPDKRERKNNVGGGIWIQSGGIR